MRRPASTKRVRHLLPVFSFAEACFLVGVVGAPSVTIRFRAARLPGYAWGRVAHLAGACWLDEDWFEDGASALGGTPCATCARGAPCAFWDRAAIDDAGYEPRQPGDTVTPADRAPIASSSLAGRCGKAAAALGLAWPCTIAEVTAAFRRHITIAHPDHGGSATETSILIAARDALLDAIRKSSAGPR